ncbi:Acetylornithine aminotransferase [Planctomycetes bacterium Pan216]|uniref:Acetylornithine aminotransferase n=1 Tax=Kolteria novifilia TaxID=2527975 RepID=A0A518BAN7_9BACT|nr:Acetylornithine aminotransferase [Planctomycetes bacterium Pan216]
MTAAMELSSPEVMDVFARYVVPNYTRYPVCLVRGQGSEVWDAEGRRYLDFFPGWGCNLLGHCPPRVVQAVQEQVAQLIHVPNSWYIESQGAFAQALVERSFSSQAFFCNSGAEANEAAIKLARAHQAPRYKIIATQQSFHGRTFAAISATGQPKYQQGFGPLLPGFKHVPFGDLEAMEHQIDDETAAIMVEPIQGEGGVNLAPEGYLEGLRKLADDRGLLLILDEVQSGMGRTGRWFAYQHTDITPDIMTLAKSLAGGVTGGAMLARPEVAASLKPGMHAATFGGNPLTCRAGLATIETIDEGNLLERGTAIGERFRKFFLELSGTTSVIREVRGKGVMIGVDLAMPGAEIVQQLLERGLLANCTHDTVLRLLPALTIQDEQIDEGCSIIADVLRSAEG